MGGWSRTALVHVWSYALLAVTALASVNRAAYVDEAPQPKAADRITFEQIVKVAHADALAATAAGVGTNVRYLSAAHMTAAERRELYKVISYHVNGLSREGDLVPPRQVTDWLWAVDVTDYGWDKKVWENLRAVNHYYCIKVQNAIVTAAPVEVKKPERVKKTRQVLRYDANGTGRYVTEEYYEDEPKDVKPVAAPTKGKEDFVAAPWLPKKITAELVAVTGSVTPIVRADEFLHQTFAQTDRNGHGYYDFLGLGAKIGDAEKLARLDRKGAIDARRELIGGVDYSLVALSNRQFARYQTLAGFWWETRDAKVSVGDKNAANNLLEDFKPDAYEIVASLPNGMVFYYLADNKGERQDTAPDFIASHKNSTDNDTRVHAGYSCAVCHFDAGLRPFEDYFRATYVDTGLTLAAIALDLATQKRIELAYIKGPLVPKYKQDVKEVGDVMEKISGLKPADLSKAIALQWSRYLNEPVTVERAATECGVTVDELQTALRRYAKEKRINNPVLARFLLNDPKPIRREHFEEMFPVLMLVLGGASP